MATEIDKVDEPLVEEDLTKLDDTTDWKAKAQELEQKRREDGIKQRERTKALKERLATIEATVKPPEEKEEEKKAEENVLLQKLERMSLRQAGITHQDDIELAKTTAKKWGMDIDEVLVDDDFKVKLEKQQTTRANTLATSGVRGGGGGGSEAKNSPDYWIAKGTPPTPADVPDRKTRATIIRAMMKTADTGGKKFYND